MYKLSFKARIHGRPRTGGQNTTDGRTDENTSYLVNTQQSAMKKEELEERQF